MFCVKTRKCGSTWKLVSRDSITIRKAKKEDNAGFFRNASFDGNPLLNVIQQKSATGYETLRGRRLLRKIVKSHQNFYLNLWLHKRQANPNKLGAIPLLIRICMIFVIDCLDCHKCFANYAIIALLLCDSAESLLQPVGSTV